MRGFSEEKIEQRRGEFASETTRSRYSRSSSQLRAGGARRDGEDRHQQAQIQELEEEVAENDQFHYAKLREIRDEDVRGA